LRRLVAKIVLTGYLLAVRRLLLKVSQRGWASAPQRYFQASWWYATVVVLTPLPRTACAADSMAALNFVNMHHHKHENVRI
jgi:hypothetical protein